MTEASSITWNLKEVPTDVIKYVLQRQGEAKARKGVAKYSIHQTIYQLLRDHQKLTDIN